MLSSHYRLIVNSVKDVIFQIDTQGVWTFLNPAWTEITGFPHGASLGRDILDFIHPDDRQALWGTFALLLAQTSDSCCYETRLLTQEGSVRWIEGHARIMTDADGSVVGIAGTLHD